MKKIKILLFVVLLMITGGCFNGEEFENNYTYTTIYPIKYATEAIYGEYTNVNSIFPSGTDIKSKTFTNKQLKTFAEGNIFIYNGLGDEGSIARDLLNINGEIRIIDAMKKMSYNNGIEELWLDPSNYLMLCRNIKESLIDYTDNIYTKEKIENNYKLLKESISELDVELYNIGKSGDYNILITSNKTFSYLEKYGISIVPLDPNLESSDKNYAEARKLVGNNKIKYVYVFENEELDKSITNFIDNYKLTKIEINPIYLLTDEEQNEGITFISKMNDVIDLYKKELYK